MIPFTKGIIVLFIVTVLLDAAQGAPAFPVGYSANNRYLVDQNGTPFPIMGRTAWFITSLSVADYRTFVDDTAARGYSAIELHVVNHDPRGNNPPFNGNGDLPFLNRLNETTWNGSLNYGNINNEAPDFTTPNEAYWSSVDGLLSYCESKGLLVFLFPAYVGYAGGNQGWMQEMVANGDTKMQSYGAWIATRYQNQKNLIWMMGGDMGTPPNAFNTAQTSVENALLTGLKSVPGQQSVLFSAEWASESIATDQANFGTSMTLNGVYSTTGDVNSHGRRAYTHSPVAPAFLLEEPYDEEGPDGNAYNPSATQPVRRFQWWGWLSTIGGYISGNGYVWPFHAQDWQEHLDTQGSRDMTRLNVFMGSIAWYNLVPSGLNGMRMLITSGGSSVDLDDYVSAAAAPDGTLVVAYVPPAHNGPIMVDMGALSGPAQARWFDPTSGAYTDIGSGLTNTGTRSFTTPGNNSAGDGDWVLVLDYVTEITSTEPTISDILDQATTINKSTAAIPFMVNDANTPLNNLALSSLTSNPALVPTNNIVFGGSESNRTVTITPADNLTGVVTITVTVSDGTNTTSDAFVLTILSSLVTEQHSSTNAATITIADSGPGSPYPSMIDVTGVGGTIHLVTVTLNNMSHTWPDDIDILLVSPTGQKVLLMSDSGGGADLNNVTLMLSDGTAAALSDSGQLTTGTFKPTNFDTNSDTFAAPAPSGPYATLLSAFNGREANGTWSLYVSDDGPGDFGAISGGWSISITTIRVETPPQITAVTLDELGAIQVNVSGEVGLSYALEASSDFSNWTVVDVQDNVTGSMVFTDQPTNSFRIYRAASVH